jgi:hypothetical protein
MKCNMHLQTCRSFKVIDQPDKKHKNAAFNQDCFFNNQINGMWLKKCVEGLQVK